MGKPVIWAEMTVEEISWPATGGCPAVWRGIEASMTAAGASSPMNRGSTEDGSTHAIPAMKKVDSATITAKFQRVCSADDGPAVGYWVEVSRMWVLSGCVLEGAKLIRLCRFRHLPAAS